MCFVRTAATLILMHSSSGARIPDLATVNSLLSRQDLGELLPETVVSHSGRHRKCSGFTTSGRGVFVKQMNAAPGQQAPGLERAKQFERIRVPGLRTPELLGSDEENNLLVFDLVPDAEPANELARESGFGPELAHHIGEVIGRLHELPLSEDISIDTSLPPYPPLDSLDGLTVGQFQTSSAAVLQGWRLLQEDQPVVDAVRALRHGEETAPKVPSHCDFRLDQILVSGQGPHIVDWEEFRFGDPARDVGMFVGEWLYLAADRAARVLHTGDAGRPRSATGATREEISAQTVIELRTVQPTVKAFWDGYRSSRGTPDPDLPRRAISYAGWHLYDRMFNVVARMALLSATQYVANGMGRRALLAPDGFARLLEMGEFDARSN
ncbi:class V lanthionine synthetase subunit LxmK [Streptomyces scopuliridis]|nr:class V lanthionine synthetase subunit LxmK [Streptomyces scopuliridis]